jgi:hypothetical protein
VELVENFMEQHASNAANISRRIIALADNIAGFVVDRPNNANLAAVQFA